MDLGWKALPESNMLLPELDVLLLEEMPLKSYFMLARRRGGGFRVRFRAPPDFDVHVSIADGPIIGLMSGLKAWQNRNG